MTVLDDPSQLFGIEAIQDPYPFYERMRAEAPVHRIGESDFYAVCGWKAVVEAVHRVEDFSSNLTATMVCHDDGTVTPFDMGAPGDAMHALATADDPVHAAHRRILLPHLSAKRVRIIEEFADETAQLLWSDSVVDGRIEWMSAVANRLPMMVVAQLLGLPHDDVDELIRLGYSTTTLLDGIVTPAQLEAAGMAAMELAGYVLEHFDKAATNPGHGLIRDMAARCASGELEHAPALNIMLTLFSAAGESTASLLGSAVWILVSRPDVQRRVRAAPRSAGCVRRGGVALTSHRSAATTDTCGATPPSAGSPFLPTRICYSCGGRPIAMWRNSIRPANFGWTEAAASRTSPLARARTSASGRRSRGWRRRSCCGCCWIAPPGSRPATSVKWLPSILVRRLEHLEMVVR